jgi:hypothetical protein
MIARLHPIVRRFLYHFVCALLGFTLVGSSVVASLALTLSAEQLRRAWEVSLQLISCLWWAGMAALALRGRPREITSRVIEAPQRRKSDRRIA